MMTCARCRGCLIGEQIETAEGRLSLVRCLNCGFASDITMSHHRLHRPEPHRAIPQPARGRAVKR